MCTVARCIRGGGAKCDAANYRRRRKRWRRLYTSKGGGGGEQTCGPSVPRAAPDRATLFGLSLDLVTLNDASKAEASSPLPRRGRVARPPPRPSPHIGDLRHRPIPLPPQEHPPQEALRSPAREGTRLLQEGVSDFVHPCELHSAMDDII